jgi:GH25 family lysozyme M1 (1,4-beta-N-acetylmuramidase)
MKFINWLINALFPGYLATHPAVVPVKEVPAPPKPVSPPVTAPSAPVPVAPHTWDGSVVLGVDTAVFQDAMTQADWASLFAKGFRWMYPKAEDGGTSQDSYFEKSKQQAKAAGFICFAGYDFFRFDQDGVAQAESLVKRTGGVKSGEGPCVIDCEWDNKSKDLGYHDSDHGGTRQMIDLAGEEKLFACLSKVEELTGVTPWLYGSTGFIRFQKPDRFLRFPFIVANYSTKLADDKVPLPAPWKQEIARQYSGKLSEGKVAEIDGDHFLGTLEQLKAYVKP